MITAILASTNYGGIGNRGALPWPKHQEDLEWFKKHTENQIVVMGRKTWNDPAMPKPLPNRLNCVVSSSHVNLQYQHQVRWFPSNPLHHIAQIQKENPNKDVFIIGGKQLYDTCEPIVSRIVLTRMKGSWFTDTKINLERMLACFRLKTVSPGKDCTYEIWDRIIFF